MEHTGGSPPSSWLDERWLDERLQRRLRHSPRLSRLVTTIDLFAWELNERERRFRDRTPPSAAGWFETAQAHLIAARRAAGERRLDDGWDFLHSAQRQALSVLTRSEARALAVSLGRESAAKLVGWRRESAATNLADVLAALPPVAADAGAAGEGATPPSDDAAENAPPGVCATLVHVQRLVHDNAHNTYLRLRLMGQRLVLATVLLALILVGLGALAGRDALDATGFEHVTALRQVGSYATITMLGMLGALLSFSIGAMAAGSSRRIYELASGRFAATLARVLVGAAAALVVAIAVQSGVVGLNTEWLLILAVAAGFSERLVKRIIESLSADAEKPQEPAKPHQAPPGDQPDG